MAKKRKKSLSDRYAPQAQAQAFLQYNPERRGLLELLQQAKANMTGDIKAARSTRRGLEASIQQALPGVEQSYGDAGMRMQNAFGQYGGNGGPTPAQGSIAEQLAKVGPAGSAIVAAALGEQSSALGRVSEGMARDQADLRSQGLRAVAGEAAAVRQARQGYRTDSGKVLDQLQALDQEQGVYTADALMKLVDAARGRGVTKRGQTLSHKDRVADRKSRETIATENRKSQERRAAAKGKINGGEGWLSDDKQETFAQKVEQAKHEAKLLIDSGASRHEAADLLLSGAPSSSTKTVPVYDPATGKKVLNADGTPKTKSVPGDDGIPQFGELVASVALDAAYDGGISHNNVKRLHGRGYRIDRLNIPTQAQRLKRHKTRPTGTKLAPGANGQTRPT